MNSEVTVTDPSMSFFNRDHVVVVTIENAQIVVTTTLGVKITIPASAATLARFVDDLANHIQSNFVSITPAGDDTPN
jgi:hypothetical protein